MTNTPDFWEVVKRNLDPAPVIVPRSWYESIWADQVIAWDYAEYGIEQPVIMLGAKWRVRNLYRSKKDFWDVVVRRWIKLYKITILSMQDIRRVETRLYEMGAGEGSSTWSVYNMRLFSHERTKDPNKPWKYIDRYFITLDGECREVGGKQLEFLQKADKDRNKFRTIFNEMEKELHDAEIGILRTKNRRPSKPRRTNVIAC